MIKDKKRIFIATSIIIILVLLIFILNVIYSSHIIKKKRIEAEDRYVEIGRLIEKEFDESKKMQDIGKMVESGENISYTYIFEYWGDDIDYKKLASLENERLSLIKNIVDYNKGNDFLFFTYGVNNDYGSVSNFTQKEIQNRKNKEIYETYSWMQTKPNIIIDDWILKTKHSTSNIAYDIPGCIYTLYEQNFRINEVTVEDRCTLYKIVKRNIDGYGTQNVLYDYLKNKEYLWYHNFNHGTLQDEQ